MLVLLQTTNACNLRCIYCSASCGETERRDLSEDDCHLLLEQLPAILKEGERVRFLWHGGEPTLLSAKKFQAMQEILSKIKAQGHPVEFSIQTNGYTISSDWLDVLEQFKMGVGLSLDGPSSLHDEMRISTNGSGSYQKIIANLKDMEGRNISVSLLSTVRKAHLGKESDMLDWLESLGHPIRFNPMLKLGRSKEELSLGEYFNFLKNILILAFKRNITLSIEPLEWMLVSVISGIAPRECSYSGGCGTSLFAYGPKGEVGVCNRSSIVHGNLYQHSLTELYETASWKEIRQRAEELSSVCKVCSIWRYCHGGCPTIESNSPIHEHCEARKEFFNWLQSKGLELYQKALIQRRTYLREQLNIVRELRQILVSPQSKKKNTSLDMR